MARLEDYAIIGDCETGALISREGALDWLCWPCFDSGACFAALIGASDNGLWRIGARDPAARISRRYRDATLILDTRIETDTGVATVTDFMPLRGEASDVVRIVKGERGVVPMRMEFIVRFDYGALIPWVTRFEQGSLKAIAGPDMVVLRTTAPLRPSGRTHVAEFDVRAGESVGSVLSYGRSYAPPPRAIDPCLALEETESYWRAWSNHCAAPTEWSDAVIRSLITLKALTHRPTGGIVAALTTSLPEQLGGRRNWDYRYCWLRDATFSLLALMNAGYFEEAEAWRQWLLRAVAGAPEQLQILYGVGGERRIAEWEAEWLCGYEGAKPVRIGNAAHSQLQLDVFGEVLDALFQGRCGKLRADDAGWAMQRAMLAHLGEIWTQPDEGIWEVRGGRRQFTFSKIMAWVAFDRAIRTVETFGVAGPVDDWRKTRRAIHAEVCARGFNEKLGAFVQSYGSSALDASLLLTPLVGFLPASDPRVRGTVEAIERRLMWNGFIKRYESGPQTDGLPSGEGVFLSCSFWFIDNLVLLGRTQEAREMFERLLSLRNDLGLLSEEYDVEAKRLVGNFPQALSHIALVNTAHNLSLAEKPAHQRSRSEPFAAEARAAAS